MTALYKMTVNVPPIIALDCDDTLFRGDRFPLIGEANQEAITELRRLKNITNAKYILYTCRDGEFLEMAVNACRKHGIPLDAVNSNCDEVPFATSTKPYADFYVDDKSALGRDPFEPGFWTDFVELVIKKWSENKLPPFYLSKQEDTEQMAG